MGEQPMTVFERMAAFRAYALGGLSHEARREIREAMEAHAAAAEEAVAAEREKTTEALEIVSQLALAEGCAVLRAERAEAALAEMTSNYKDAMAALCVADKEHDEARALLREVQPIGGAEDNGEQDAGTGWFWFRRRATLLGEGRAEGGGS